MKLSDRQMHILRHSLGLEREKESYRNHFVTGEGSDDHPDCVRLVELGYMKRFAPNEMWGDMDLFVVTEEGKEVVKENQMLKNNIVLTNHLFWLIANYEADEPYEDGEKAGILFGLKELQDWKDRDHHGDCTNEPYTCMRCFAEHCWNKACWIVDNLPYNNQKEDASTTVVYGSEQGT